MYIYYHVKTKTLSFWFYGDLLVKVYQQQIYFSIAQVNFLRR